MLKIKNIKKVYHTSTLKQVALDDVSINFRKNEFVSILGPSGSGKTTLLNIIGGLDHYDSGDLIINNVSTKKYKDRDWDTYRNHRVGFVFQSYNLIAHQTVLKNVELALTLSGVSKKERIKRAKDALKQVGLEDHIYKKPNQLSGGQMQRVAIARALVNDPDIILADEPTGALDSKTSEQIMEIIKSISKDKLVIMVTHNPEIAQMYSTRIIKLKDGKIIDDSNPYEKEEEELNDINNKKTFMSLKTALGLSLNNLLTKKGRTFLTAFAGSIGIIGIALILSLSNGVRKYIEKTEKETLASYPITIEKETIKYSNVFSDDDKEVSCKKNKICTKDDITTSSTLKTASSTVKNNLKDFKKALDNNYKNIKKYTTDINYSYDLDLQIYSKNNIKVNPNTFDLNEMVKPTDKQGKISMTFDSSNEDRFEHLIGNNDLLESEYKVLAGKMPTKYNELILVTDEKNQIPVSLMYSLDIENRDELKETINQIKDGKKINLKSINYDYNKIIGTKYKLVLNTDYFVKENDTWIDKSEDQEFLNDLIKNGEELEIVGVAKAKNDTVTVTSSFVGYTQELETYVINKINQSNIAKTQLENKNIDVFTNEEFKDNTYEDNLKLLGICDEEDPFKINLFPKNYDSKTKIQDIIDEYNKSKKTKDKIEYTDIVGSLMSGITTIVNIVSYVLIAFVAISLIVSSIMISIITYISVLERTKEIGILRAIGASKKDITRVFRAETIIEGLIAGIFGILVTLLLNVPINAIVKSVAKVDNIAKLPFVASIVLIGISVLLTVIAGLIPSRIASKKDPVEALRTE